MALTVANKAEYDLPDTKDIKCPKIKVELSVDFDESDVVEQAKYAYYKKNAQKQLDNKLKERGKQFDGPMKDAQRKVDAMKATIEKLKRDANNPSKWPDLGPLFKKLWDEKKKMEEFLTTANKLLEGAVDSIKKIEADRWMEEVDVKAHEYATKKLRSTARWKKFRLVAKVILIGTVILATAAIGIAASVVTMNPGPLALAAVIIGGVVSGSSALIGVGKLIKKNWMSESSVMKKIGEDLAALGKVTEEIKSKRNPQLKKHLSELAGYRAERAKSIRDLGNQIAEMEKEVNKLTGQLNQADTELNPKTIVAKKKSVLEFKAALKVLKIHHESLNLKDKAAQDVIKSAKEVLDDFETIGQIPISGLPTTWEKIRGNLGGATSNLSGALSSAMGLAAGLKS